MRTAIHRLTQDLFSLLFWTVVSLLSSIFLSLSFSCAIFNFCSSSVFSNCDIFCLHSNFCFWFLRLLTISLFLYFLSRYFRCSFGCPIFLQSMGFGFSCVRSLAHFPFLLHSLSFSLSLFLFLLFSIVYEILPFFLFVSFWFNFLFFIVLLNMGSWCSYAFCSIMFFLFFPFSSIAFFLSLFLVNSFFFRLSLPLAFSQTRFFCFPLCFPPSFVLCHLGFFVFLNLFALRLIINFCCYRSISLSPSL